jgi:hypothetical protein
MLKAKFFGRFTVFLSISFSAQAQMQLQDVQIIDVRRNIPLSDDAPVYKDFYLNGGLERGLKKNQTITVVRKMAVRDAMGSQTFGELMIPVGQLKVIAVNDRIAVAREVKLISRDEEPMLEQIGIMNGDLIQLK